jgi:tetratricopeptide (TPR) repeat protein
MSRIPSRIAFLIFFVLAVGRPVIAGNDPDDTITVDQLPLKLKPQFDTLIQDAHGDQKKILAITKAKHNFELAIKDPAKVKPDSKFDPDHIKGVGPIIGNILKIQDEHEKNLAAAKTEDQRQYVEASYHVQMKDMGVKLAAFTAPVGAPSHSPTAPDPTSGQGSQGQSSDNEGGKDRGHDRGGGPNLGKIAGEAANQAEQEVYGTGGSQAPAGNTGGMVPNAPSGTSGAGAISGGAGGPSGAGQTSGSLLGVNDPNSPGDAMADARELARGGDIAAGLANASRAVDLGGGADALALRGGMLLDQKQYSQASQDAQKALQLDPSNQEALAVKHFAEGRIDGASDGGPAAANAGVAGAGGRSGHAADGYAGGYSGASSLGASSTDKIAGIPGSLGSSRGAPSSAMLAGMSSGQAQKAGQNALGMKDYAAAMAFSDRALAQDPKNPSLFNLRSSIHAQQHDYDKAVEDAKAGLALSPKDSQLMRSLGFAQLRDKDYKGALATANQMLELNPNDPYAYALRAHAYGSMGDRDAMMADLKRAAELDPSFQDAAAKMAGQLQLPTDQDILFLFPGEEAANAAKTAAPAGGKPRLFGLLVGASVLGGLLLAFVLLNTVLAPLKAQVSSAITRITRTGPTIGAEIDNDTLSPPR